MKAINKGFLEKVFPIEQVRFAFTLKHIDRYKHYYSVSDLHRPRLLRLTCRTLEPFQVPILEGSRALCERREDFPLGELQDEQKALPCDFEIL
jgi:hypothetical protein